MTVQTKIVAEKIEIDLDTFYDLDGTVVDTDSWRWGWSHCYHVKYLDKDWLTEYIRYTDDGCQLEPDDKVTLFLAHQVPSVKWEIIFKDPQ